MRYFCPTWSNPKPNLSVSIIISERRYIFDDSSKIVACNKQLGILSLDPANWFLWVWRSAVNRAAEKWWGGAYFYTLTELAWEGWGRFKRFLGPCYELRGSHFRSVDSGTAWTETCEHFARGWKFLLGIRAASKEHLGCSSRILGLMSAILCDRVTEFWLEEYFISFFSPLLLSLSIKDRIVNFYGF